MNENSLLAYSGIKGNITVNQMAVYEVVKDHGGMTNLEIAQMLGWEINKVTGRTNELWKNGYFKREKKKEMSGTRKHWINELV